MYFAFDTSNYKTSAAYFDDENMQGKNYGELLEVSGGHLGLRQSDAVFAHVKKIPGIIEKLLDGSRGFDINAVGASTKPRQTEGSYMPCFLVGEGNARSLASINKIPFYGFSHQQGHIAAAAYSADKLSILKHEFLAWHLSGGTTELLLVKPDAADIISETIIGRTTDISAGQLIDRTGVMLGLKFPAGPQLSAFAEQCKSVVKPFKIKVENSCFSLSGMENQVNKLIENHERTENICQFVLNTVLYTITKATEQAIIKYPGYPILCSGGVMSNKMLADKMKSSFNAYFAAPALSSDNALGIAILSAIRDGATFWNKV